MDNSTYVSLSLALSLERSLDVTANNIANSNTAGFKAGRSDFESLVQQVASDSGDTTLSYVSNAGSHLDDRPGPLQKTGNPLDVALSGDGWFSYQTGTGQRAYGRDGRLNIDAQGNLVTVTGARVLDAAGSPVSIPATSAAGLHIGSDGTITDRDGQNLGKIGVFTVPGIATFQRSDGGMFMPPDGAGAGQSAATDYKVAQGFLEQSNVEPVLEMTRMMQIQRAYDRAMKLMDDQDSLRKQTLSQIGRST